MALEVLFQDADLLVIDKPAGLLTTRGRWDPAKPTVLDELAAARPATPLALVHRIDKDTSGLLVLSKNRDAARSLSMQWMRRTVRKEYLALVVGAPETDSFTIDLPLLDDPDEPRVFVSRRRGASKALTECQVTERFRGFTLLGVRLHTGRRHQIRAHLAAVGLPIVADKLYGDGEPLLLSQFKRRKGAGEERPLMARTALHAALLEFDHPSTGQRLRFEAPLPKDFAITLRNLRKYRST